MLTGTGLALVPARVGDVEAVTLYVLTCAANATAVTTSTTESAATTAATLRMCLLLRGCWGGTRGSVNLRTALAEHNPSREVALIASNSCVLRSTRSSR